MTSPWHNYKDLPPWHLPTQSGMTPSLVLALALSLCSISAKADFNVFRPLSLSQLLAPVEGTEINLKTLTHVLGWQSTRPGGLPGLRPQPPGEPALRDAGLAAEDHGAHWQQGHDPHNQVWRVHSQVRAEVLIRAEIHTCLHLKGSSWNSRESWEGSRIVSRLVTELEQKSHNLYKQQEHRGESLFLQNK